MSDPVQILLCRCSKANVLPRQAVAVVEARLSAGEVPFIAVEDLCGMAALRDPLMKRLADNGPLKIVACHARALKWLFAVAGASLSQAHTQICNLRVESEEVILAALLAPQIAPNLPPDKNETAGKTLAERDQSSKENKTSVALEDWKPWYPLIDYDRCTHCMQCLSFCLFGVFGVDLQGRIQVSSPLSCKPNCPACSRVCPEAAIMFPKYNSGPINGEPVAEGNGNREVIKADISALLGGDMYARLRQRSGHAKERFSKERDPETALKERQKCLARLVQEGGIPPEVLMALPSPEEIQRRAAEAKAKAEEALKAQSAAKL